MREKPLTEPDAGVGGTRRPAASEKLAIGRAAPGNGNHKDCYAIRRHLTREGVHPFDQLEWETRAARITNDQGEVIFEQKDAEVPKNWSQNATNVVASKYFNGGLGDPHRERSVKDLINRVVRTTARWGLEGRYFISPEEAQTFESELTHILANQLASFNSPVWFNLGIEERPQISACFINSVQDSMDSILELAKTEATLFKYGSGSGTNLSPIRSSKERITRGGRASGPVSFMKGYDAFASVIKSGGKTRRAAKMQILNIDHPDIVAFVRCKYTEEKKAWALIDAGYDSSIDGEAYGSVFFQNSNLSVRVNDEFMRAVEKDKTFSTKAVTTGKPMESFKARDLMGMIADAAHKCGDPGLQFDDTVNHWNPCADTERIHASNPCSEFMFLNDSACNLASLNLLKFLRDDGTFDTAMFTHCVHVVITAMEIFVGNAFYPTARIRENSLKYRPLGLGYANLGALLMARGLPYDSDEGRAYASAITALMCGQAYRSSAEIASRIATFDAFEPNRRSFMRVIRQHADAVKSIDKSLIAPALYQTVDDVWKDVLELGMKYGFRNAQTTVLAPTGTIAFMMDCDTTGIEPDIALIKYKKLVGGGMMKIVNNTVPQALRTLGYDEPQVKGITEYLQEKETVEGAPLLKSEHLEVFDCAFQPRNGTRSIHYRGHIRMMAAVQPFISGAISKTVNLPEAATVEDIEKVAMEAWKLGLKAIAVYRDGCKRVQPLSTSSKEKSPAKEKSAGPVTEKAKPVRRRLPDERSSITHKFSVAGYEGYITVGMYPDGMPGEIFVTMAKQGSTISGLIDTIATATSIALQYGVPLEVLVRKFSHTRFEPSGPTPNRDIPIAKSVVDYIFRWLGLKFCGTAPADEEGTSLIDDLNGASAKKKGKVSAPAADLAQKEADAPACYECGAIMVRAGACYQCPNCGVSSGCG